MLQLFTKKHRGFTLIELLVVIAIIGVLASIVLVSMGGARKAARNTARKADMRQIISAMEMCYDAQACGGEDKYITSGSYPLAIGTFMVQTPKDPQGTTYGWISNTGADQKFCAYATLEDDAACLYYTASHGGNFCKTAAPAAGATKTALENCALSGANQ